MSMRAAQAWLTAPTPVGRVLRGAGANAYDKGVILLVQLVSIPLLSREWGAEGYGSWLMLMTVPVYLQLADLGLNAAATVAMTRSMALGDLSAARQTFRCMWLFVTGLSLAVAGSVIAGAALFADAPAAVALVTLYALLAVQCGVLLTVCRATDKFAASVIFSGSALLAEGAAVVLAAWAGGGIVAALSAMLVLRAGALASFAIWLRRVEPWARPGFRGMDKARLRELARPSLSALSLTLAGAITLQGSLLTLGWTAGAAVVAVFGGARTVSRAPLQLAGLFTRPSIPELTRAQLGGDTATIGRLNRLNMIVAIAATVPFAFVLAAFGPRILATVSGGALSAPAALFGLLGAAAAANAFWTAAAAPLVAANRQGSFGPFYFLSCSCAAATPFVARGEPALSLAAAMLASELFCCLVVAGAKRRGRAP